MGVTGKRLRFADVEVGDELPELAIDVTATLVVAGALASRDFTPVHHDKTHAQSQGLSDVIMNTMTTNGLVCRYLTDWAGPDAAIRGVALKLGVPNVPGERMKLVGRVTAKEAQTGVVTVAVTGRNSWGDHVSATARVALTKGA
jgi:acyl dehydratase